jgi:hypothetical protein
MSEGKYRYVFTGTATVSVECFVDADSEREARALLDKGECEWKCDEVDGDVSEVELTESDEPELPEHD